MGVDFNALVLAPGQAVFSRPVLITPLKSLPNAIPYIARGVWTVESTSILTEDGGNFSSMRMKLSIRLADFMAAPKQGDWITSKYSDLPLGFWQGDYIDPNSGIDFVIDDFTPDGQGAAMLILKRVT